LQQLDRACIQGESANVVSRSAVAFRGLYGSRGLQRDTQADAGQRQRQRMADQAVSTHQNVAGIHCFRL
jgi:hypothetical protein